MTQDPWSPGQYERFRDERGRPFHDLLALVQPREGMHAVDLGCGTGELTRELHRTLRCSATLGIDASAAMLEKSAAYVEPGLRFARADIAHFTSGGWDLVFSNAALQWLPDHPALFARLARLVAEGGQLAVQMPANHDHPTHTVAQAVAREEPFRSALGGHVRESPVLAPERCAELLHELGFREQHVRLQVYAHELASREDAVEWVKGTLLTDYEKRLPAELWPRFLERYREALFAALPDRRPFLFPFKRLLMWGRR